MKDSNIAREKHGILLLALFILIIIGGFAFSMYNIEGIVKTGGGAVLSVIRRQSSVSSVPTSFENYYNSLYSKQPVSLDIFSLTQRALGKHEARNFEVLKSDDDALYLGGNKDVLDVDKLEKVATQCKAVYDATNEYGGHFIYVQVPFKNVGVVKELADYSSDITEESESYVDNLIRQKGIPVLDLREYEECKEYYRTDHHWTVQSAFNASGIIANEIQRIYGIDLVGHEYYADMNNYESVSYNNSFLGSIGIKVGRFFAGKDDFVIYKPKFDTDITFVHKDKKKPFEYAGDFWETFVDQKMLEDSSYNNKYDANMHGAYVESIIRNNLAQNNYRGLLVTHSYGRAMAQYMSLDYSELRYLDPQKGRYNDNILEYVREYKPDVVIYMYNNVVNIGDGSWKE